MARGRSTRLCRGPPSRVRTEPTNMITATFASSRSATFGFAAATIVLAAASALALAVFPEPRTWIAPTILLASTISSIAGFAFPAICGAVVFHLSIDKVEVIEIMMTCGIANQALMSWSVRSHIDWRVLRRTLMGGFVGLPLGVLLLIEADRRAYTAALGLFLISFGLLRLCVPRFVARSQPAIVDFVAGFAGGVTGGAAALPGAFVTIWSALKGLPKDRQRGIFQPFIMIMQLAGLATIACVNGGGTFARGYDMADLLFVPYSLIGTVAGLILYRLMSDRQFGVALNLLLVACGSSYLF